MALLIEGFTEALEMHDFTLAEELNGVADIGITNQPQEVIIGGAGLLLRGHALNSSSNFLH